MQWVNFMIKASIQNKCLSGEKQVVHLMEPLYTDYFK